MANVSAKIGPCERMELRDGIFYYVKQSRSRGTVALAAPKARVDVVHRAEHRRIRWRKGDGGHFWFTLILLLFLAPAVFEPSLTSWMQAAGVFVLVFTYFSANVVSWRLKRGRVQTKIVVEAEHRKIPILFTYAQGLDPDLESLLDCLQRCEELESVRTAKGCAVELLESQTGSAKFLGYAVGILLLVWSTLFDDQEAFRSVLDMGSSLLSFQTLLGEEYVSTTGRILVLGLACMLLGFLLSRLTNRPFGVAVRAARGAMLDGEVETAAMMARAILQKRPYHFYANYLMTFHAVMTGDLEAAAQHRAAMNGNTGRERLSIIIASFTRDLSSAPAFRVLANYARGVSGATQAARGQLVSP